MPWGLFFFSVPAVLLCARPELSRSSGTEAQRCLLLLAASFLLLFLNIPLTDRVLNPAPFFVWICGLRLLMGNSTLHRLRCALISLILAALIFLLSAGILWQLEPMYGSWEPLLIPAGCILLSFSGGYTEALLGGALAVSGAALAGIFLLGSEMTVLSYALWGWLSGGAWLLLWIFLRLRRLFS